MGQLGEKFHLIRDWVDTVCLQVLKSAKGSTQKPSTFCGMHKDVLRLIMNEATLNTVVQHEGEWGDVEWALLELVNGSQTGAKLFESSSAKVPINIWGDIQLLMGLAC